MRRLALPSVIAACLVGLLAACFGRVVLRGEQFSYRDAGMYYYPLYHRVQAEWKAGRVPLWDDGENAGMPLLGNPTAAVLYPPKLAVFAILPYPSAVRVYAIAHVVLGFAGMIVLMRHWRISPAGAALGAFGYAFGGPVISLTCNVVFLVGAAWLPWGLWATDRWLREGRRDGLFWLAKILALLVLGGDPECAYLIGICGGGYALGLAGAGRPRRALAIGAGAIGIAWGLAAVEAAARVASHRQQGRFTHRPEMITTVAPFAWIAVGVLLLVVAWRGRRSATSRRLWGLAVAAGLAAMIAAAQLLPVAEFMGQTGRATTADEKHNTLLLSIEPGFLPGLLWPNLPGTIDHGSRLWLDSIVNRHQWYPSLYPGVFVLILGLGAIGWRGGPAWRGWLTAIAAVGLLVALGPFAGPLWWLRWIPTVAANLGGHDPADAEAFRLDGHLADAWGSPYWAMAHVLPGFGQFRYPAKVFPFVAAAVAALAGVGWDRLVAGQAKRAARIAGLCLATTVLLLVGCEASRSSLVASLAKRAIYPTLLGPLDAAGAFRDIRAGLIQAAIGLALLLGLARMARRRPGYRWIAALGLVAVAVDLAVANGPLILSVPQALFEEKPEVVRAIEEAERADPSPGPFRVHRVPLWNPDLWMKQNGPDRLAEILRWEVDTLSPKYGLLWGIDATETFGVGEVHEYHLFFNPFRRAIDARGAALLGIEPGRKIVVSPRRGFDLWNTRYFITPTNPRGWVDGGRAYASLIEATDQIAPPPGDFAGAEGERRKAEYVEGRDFQVLRNRNAFPRAWVVHDARFVGPLAEQNEAETIRDLLLMLYQDDALWHVPKLAVEDLRRVARVEDGRATVSARDLSRLPTDPSEAPAIVRHDPGHVEIDVTLKSPGLVVLADLFYPGWELTIDGQPAPILRTNYLMRGAKVGVGRHRLVYRYRPASARVGAVVSVIGLVLFAGLVVREARRGKMG